MEVKLTKTAQEFYKAITGINLSPEVGSVVDDTTILSVPLPDCGVTVEIGGNWYECRDCRGNILTSSDKMKGAKGARKAAFDVRRSLVDVLGLTEQATMRQQKEHPLLVALGYNHQDVNIEDGKLVVDYYGMPLRVESPNSFRLGDRLFRGVTPRTIASILKSKFK